MNLSKFKIAVLCFVGIWVIAPSSQAHILDELAQSSFISISPEDIKIEILLTPGMKIAEEIYKLIDSNHDGLLSELEKKTFASGVLGHVTLMIDNQKFELKLANAESSSLDEMKEGVGKFRVLAEAQNEMSTMGNHTLHFMNTFLPMISVYNINALMPDIHKIEIIEQERDQKQFENNIAYKQLVNPNKTLKWWWCIPIVLGIVGLFLRRGNRQK